MISRVCASDTFDGEGGLNALRIWSVAKHHQLLFRHGLFLTLLSSPGFTQDGADLAPIRVKTTCERAHVAV
jgi:hypothetical protein